MTFENRLHQLPTSSSDIINFYNEGFSFLAIVYNMNLNYLVIKWNNEFLKKGYGAYNYPVFTNDSRLMTDANGNVILDANGNPILTL